MADQPVVIAAFFSAVIVAALLTWWAMPAAPVPVYVAPIYAPGGGQ